MPIVPDISLPPKSIITKNQNLTTMDKILKNNRIMGLVALATFAIVAYVLVYKPWKAEHQNA